MSDWLAGAAVLAAVPLVWLLMYLGWRARARRQDDLTAPANAPDGGLGQVWLAPTEAVYVSTVRHGDWLNRVVRHGLGVRSRARVSVGSAGVWWQREGAPDLFVPAGDVTAVGRSRGQAGKYTAEQGLVVVTWRLGEVLVDTAFRPRDYPDIASVEAGLARLVPVQAP